MILFTHIWRSTCNWLIGNFLKSFMSIFIISNSDPSASNFRISIQLWPFMDMASLNVLNAALTPLQKSASAYFPDFVHCVAQAHNVENFCFNAEVTIYSKAVNYTGPNSIRIQLSSWAPQIHLAPSLATLPQMHYLVRTSKRRAMKFNSFPCIRKSSPFIGARRIFVSHSVFITKYRDVSLIRRTSAPAGLVPGISNSFSPSNKNMTTTETNKTNEFTLAIFQQKNVNYEQDSCTAPTYTIRLHFQ